MPEHITRPAPRPPRRVRGTVVTAFALVALIAAAPLLPDSQPGDTRTPGISTVGNRTP